MLKRFFRSWITQILSWQVSRLHKSWNFRVVAVVGSVGKTTTKHVIAQYLEHSLRVRYQYGNYNDATSVPLVLFGQSMPNIFNPLSWLVIFIKNEFKIRHRSPIDVAVVELGTDGPGQIKEFASYLHVDVAVLTSIAAEHMEQFRTLDAVAEEELAVNAFSDTIVVNIDDVASRYHETLSSKHTYGTAADSDVQIIDRPEDDSVELRFKGGQLSFTSRFIGPHVRKAYAAAYLVADVIGAQLDQPTKAFTSIQPMPGRLNRLQGIHGSVLIDDSYNASPESVTAALDVLYTYHAKKKIAVLGNMNEMGDYSQKAHEQVARHISEKEVSEVVLLGEDAVRYIEPIVAHTGLHLSIFNSPYEIGEYLVDVVDKDTAVLFKGSQNGVYLEEAIKPLLNDKADSKQLVRQSDAWIKKKRRQFAR